MTTAKRDMIVIGGSAGALTPLSAILSQLPKDLPAAVLVCLHRHAESDAYLASALAPRTTLRVLQPGDRHPLENAGVLVAPPNHHMMVEEGAVRLTHGPRENMCRPAIDVLFRSAAVEAGPRAIGVLLSGMLDDGHAGLRALLRCGGAALVQSPDEAEFPDMPRGALRAMPELESLSVAGIAPRLEALLAEPVRPDFEAPPDLLLEREMAFGRSLGISQQDRLGARSDVTCPECQGALWELEEGPPLRYRCHTGHAFSLESLGSAQLETIEASLWTAMRALRERSAVVRRLGERARTSEDRAKWERQADELDRSATTIGDGLVSLQQRPRIA